MSVFKHICPPSGVHFMKLASFIPDSWQKLSQLIHEDILLMDK